MPAHLVWLRKIVTLPAAGWRLEWVDRSHGVARLVVGKNLGADTLQRWLAEQGYAVQRAASAKGFRVLVVGRPERS